MYEVLAKVVDETAHTVQSCSLEGPFLRVDDSLLWDARIFARGCSMRDAKSMRLTARHNFAKVSIAVLLALTGADVFSNRLTMAGIIICIYSSPLAPNTRKVWSIRIDGSRPLSLSFSITLSIKGNNPARYLLNSPSKDFEMASTSSSIVD